MPNITRRPVSCGGIGIGLTLCRRIVEAHGGAISAQNRTGGGTLLRLRLPATP